MVDSFVYSQPVKIYFGAESFKNLGAILEEQGLQRAVLVCGRHFGPEAEAMKDSDPRFVGVFSGVEQNPRLSGVETVTALARETGADCIVGIGGGSSLDTAKFAAAVAPNEGKAIDYYKGDRAFNALSRLAVIAVPTTAGTGSEVTQVSVVSHETEKKTINNPAFMPRAAIVDPVLSSTVPPRTTMNTGLDAMAHALEGYWSINHQPITDIIAKAAVKLVLDNLEKAYKDGSDMEARSAMAYYHLPHGEACAFTLDSFVKINADDRLEELAHAVGLRDTEELAAKIRELKALAGLRSRISDLRENVDTGLLAEACSVHPLMNNNPVKLSVAELKEMFDALR